MKSVWTLLEAIGSEGRPDAASSNKGMSPMTARPGDFPYDRDTNYGQPAAYDRGSNMGRDGGDAQLTPKDTKHSPWEDLDEVLGSPSSPGMASNNDGAVTTPGSAKGWASSPAMISDDDMEIPEDELDTHRTAGPGDGQFSSKATSLNTARNESKVWRALAEAFISLKGTPLDQMRGGTGVHDAQADAVTDEFNDAADVVGAGMDKMDEPGIVKTLMTLDPDHTAKHLGSIGKDKLIGIYKDWTKPKAEPADGQHGLLDDGQENAGEDDDADHVDRA